MEWFDSVRKNALNERLYEIAMRQKANQIQSIKAKDARIAELEQGTVPPQNFDNSQGSPDASASNDRLVDAYNNGDRSPAAVEAARRMTFGS